MTEKYRNRFLEGIGIAETDQLFLYHYSSDSIFTLPVQDLSLSAHITPYETYEPITHYDYYVGFELAEDFFDRHTSHPSTDAFIYIGQEHPFVQGGFKAMIWHKIELDTVPGLFQEMTQLDRNYPIDPKSVYQCQMSTNCDNRH